MVAAAATIAVVYPHMNSLGGDGFWLIAAPGAAPLGIDACGAAARLASADIYRAAGFDAIPHRGGWAANTVAGTVSGWQAALEQAGHLVGNRLPMSRLLADAIDLAEQGVTVTASQHRATTSRQAELAGQPGFAGVFLPGGLTPATGDRLVQPALGATLRRLAEAGLDDFYRGDIARSMATDLQRAVSPLTLADLASHRAAVVNPLSIKHSAGTLTNLPPPTQGLVTLLVIGILDRVLGTEIDPLGAPFVHASVEATKLAFDIRDRVITDPAFSPIDCEELLSSPALDTLATRLDPHRAAPWAAGREPSDTVWLGVIDGSGMAVSFIQSTYHEFGSGLVLPESGVTWQNRGCSFSLDPRALNPLMPGRKPFHTLNPAMAELDGRMLVLGSMGGDGQPQSISAVFNRIDRGRMSPEEAVAAPRWLLGRTWGSAVTNLRMEARFDGHVVDRLLSAGHDVDVIDARYSDTMGHAGAVILHPDWTMEGAHDPRADGGAAGV